jgi:hypothetical protein
VFCTSCGTENPASNRFCAHCGAPLPQSGGVQIAPDSTGILSAPIGDELDPDFSPAAHQGEIDALAPGSALLVVRRGPNAGSRFLLDRDVTTAGRHPDSDIFLDDVTVSRRHVEFVREADASGDGSDGGSGGGFRVQDVGSLNGTYVNRERIESAALTGGDEVQIGKFRLVYFTAAQARADGGGDAGAYEPEHRQ